MRRCPRLVSIVLACATVVSAQDPVPAPAPKPAEKPAPLILGGKVPAGTVLRDLQGKEVDLGALRDKVVVLHFWSTTCPYEAAAEPKLNQLASDFAGKDVVVFGVAANQNEIGEPPAPEAFAAEDPQARPYASLRQKVAKSELNHSILVDHDAVLGKLLDARSTPHCFVFDRQGALRYRGALDDDPKGKNAPSTAQYVRIAVDSLLAGEKVPTEETQPYG